MANETAKSDVAPNRAERKLCWDSRDTYWACLDKYGLESAQCESLKNVYETACPAQWVKHFDRKYVYGQYKKKIEKEGYEPISDPTLVVSPSSTSGDSDATTNRTKSSQ